MMLSDIRSANTEQQRAIEARNPLVVVSAGAGTGKTWTLASRYLSLLNECGIKDILTLTFTEKAAQEMRERIEKMAADSGLGGLFFDEAYISTIHSFAWRTLREAGLSVDIDPSSQIISDPQADEIRSAFARSLDERTGVDTLLKYSPDDITALAEACDDIHSALGRTPEDFLNLRGDEALKNVLADLRDMLVPHWNEAWDEWHEVIEAVRPLIAEKLNKKNSPEYVKKFDNFIKIWSGKNFDENVGREFFVSIFKELSGNIGEAGKIAQDILGKSPKDWRDERKNFLFLSENLDIDELKNNFADDFREREEIINLCAEGWEYFEQSRRQSGLLSFSDLILFAASSPPTDKFRHVMIDEFQDTDPLQDKMARGIAGDGCRVFVVGDPKQSIYAFRNADLKIFSKYAEEASKSGNEYIAMRRSFRMRKALCDGVNAIFSHVWPESLGRAMPNLKYESLQSEPNAERDAQTLPPLTFLIEQKTDEDGRKTSPAQKRLIEKLAATLKNRREEGLTVWDGELKTARPFEWSDCAILTPTRTSWPIIDDIFTNFGIPLNMDNGTSWFSYGEVTDVVNMLRALADPDDELANAGWRSSIFAPRDEADARMMRRTALLHGASGALEKLLDNIGWLKNVPVSRRQRTVANVRHAALLAREYENSIYKSLPGCAEWLSDALRSERKFDEPRFDDGGNSVKLLTVHASKGLEFPFVILLGAEKSPHKSGRGASKTFTASKQLGAFSSTHEAFKNIHKAFEREAAVEENQRLFYVAATRAKDSLLICGTENADGSVQKDSWLDFVKTPPCPSGIPPLRGGLSRVSPKAPLSEGGVAQATGGVKFLPEGQGRVPVPLPHTENSLLRMSATSFALYEHCPFAWRRRYRQGLPLDWENYADADTVSLGSDVGSIAHWILARWDFSSNIPDEKNILRLPPRLRGAFRELYRSRNIEILKKWLADLSASKTGKFLHALNAEKKLERERSFKVKLGNLRLVGSVDLFWEDEDGLHVRDWKTSSKLENLYENQILFYAVALQKKIASMALISVRDGEETKIELDALEGMEQKISDAAKGALRFWKPKRENCNSCPFACGV